MKNGKYIVQTLSDHGYEGYFVGGYVRDMLLKRPSNDIDIATNALPDEVMEIFVGEGFTVIPTGIDHGTVTVMIDSIPYEITTFREDVSCDGRNATIRYAESLEIDLSRRDFTMNAIAYCPIKEQFIDPFKGQRDIENRVIRAIGDPRKRFEEDFLRMFRAFRFEATLDDFVLDIKTLCALKHVANNSNWVNRLSTERIKIEIDKVFKNSNEPGYFISQLYWYGILQRILPEVAETYGIEQHKFHSHDVWRHTLMVLDNVPKEFPLIRWAALFHDIGKLPAREWSEKKNDWTFHNHEEDSARMTSEILERLKFSNDDGENVLHLVASHMSSIDEKAKNPAIRRFIKRIGVENLPAFMIFKEADKRGNKKNISSKIVVQIASFKSRIIGVLNAPEVPVFDTKALAINGIDVMMCLDIPSGPEVGRVLNSLLELVLDNPELNNIDDLSKIVRAGKEA